MTDKDYINIAIDIAENAYYPYGAIVVKKGKIIGRSDIFSKVSETEFGHAEMIAIENAMSELGGYLCAEEGKECIIYSSCEPCLMCFGAILYTGIGRAVYAAKIEDSAGCVNEVITSVKDVATLCKSRKIIITGPVERDRAVKVMQAWKAKQN